MKLLSKKQNENIFNYIYWKCLHNSNWWAIRALRKIPISFSKIIWSVTELVKYIWLAEAKRAYEWT